MYDWCHELRGPCVCVCAANAFMRRVWVCARARVWQSIAPFSRLPSDNAVSGTLSALYQGLAADAVKPLGGGGGGGGGGGRPRPQAVIDEDDGKWVSTSPYLPSALQASEALERSFEARYRGGGGAMEKPRTTTPPDPALATDGSPHVDRNLDRKACPPPPPSSPRPPSPMFPYQHVSVSVCPLILILTRVRVPTASCLSAPHAVAVSLRPCSRISTCRCRSAPLSLSVSVSPMPAVLLRPTLLLCPRVGAGVGMTGVPHPPASIRAGRARAAERHAPPDRVHLRLRLRTGGPAREAPLTSRRSRASRRPAGCRGLWDRPRPGAGPKRRHAGVAVG